MIGSFTLSSYRFGYWSLSPDLTKTKTIKVEYHDIWFKRWFNPIFRKLFKLEITTLLHEEKVVGYGIRKKL